jgi:hypothetical protein
MTETGVWFRIHAVQRMFERDVSVKNVIGAVTHGETIEDYSDEMPEPGRLILGHQGRRPFHVVASGDQAAHESIVITVYLPTREHWKKDLKTRRP